MEQQVIDIIAAEMGVAIGANTSKIPSCRRKIDIAETLLPLPDSPTSATVRFAGTSKLTPRTA